MRRGFRVIACVATLACGKKQVTTAPPPPPAPPAVEVLARYLEGTFDSAAQAAENPAYYSVRLEVCRVEVPELGAHVFYVEQALMKRLEAPYRQRLYVLEAGDPAATRATSRVFELVDPKAAISLCANRGALKLSPTDVVERAGCAVSLRLEGDRLVGGTAGKDCPSDLNGASYATSDVVLTAGAIDSWDRGFTAEDTQVWGAETGPYHFERRTPIAP